MAKNYLSRIDVVTLVRLIDHLSERGFTPVSLDTGEGEQDLTEYRNDVWTLRHDYISDGTPKGDLIASMLNLDEAWVRFAGEPEGGGSVWVVMGEGPEGVATDWTMDDVVFDAAMEAFADTLI